MKKRICYILCLALSLAVLTGCSLLRKTPEVVTIPDAQTPAPVQTAAPVFTPTPTPLPTPVPTPFPTPVPTPFPTFMSAPVPTTAPTPQSNLPRITKDPTDETVTVNGKCQFVTRYENADLAEWHFVSPDGSMDVSYLAVQNSFPTLKIIGGNTKDMTLEGIPEALNGCRVYCRFSNRAGSVNSGSALITVKSVPGYQTPAPQRQGFEGRWADEIAGRCQVYITYRGEGSVNVDISWSGSAWQRARWQMTADVTGYDLMTYEDGHAWVETYTDNNSFTVSDESFGGTGSFYMQDGKLHWFNGQTGEDMVLIPA